ncbi:hypothetical protein PoB_003685600 [Plakobranchus ocellatus]|uniref:Uncharacterized protein n=1 Tax=Plakobranchus ocellatus TaxID=259542 RepID=A0AAV4AUW9_9GAST|nr:hypothetical protein PoB_003685600 [Plakobranchus ocellatus]
MTITKIYVCRDGGRSIVDAQWRPLDNKVQMSNDCVADVATAQPIRCSLLGPLLIIDAISHLGCESSPIKRADMFKLPMWSFSIQFVFYTFIVPSFGYPSTRF